jgi:hypothetical protein
VLHRREPARHRPPQLRLVLRGRLRIWPLSGGGDYGVISCKGQGFLL